MTWRRRSRWLAVLVAGLLLSACDAELLCSVDERQANEVVALLQKYNIKTNKLKGEKQSFRVTVEEGDFAAAVDLLNTYGLPSPADVEIAQVFPADALVSTPIAERARLLSAIERRLEQSLMRIDQVVGARVHASYELEGAERRKTQRAMRLSVLLNYEGDLEEGLFIEKIKRFVKNGFHELRYEDIAVALFKRPELVLPMGQPKSIAQANRGAVLLGLGTLCSLAAGGGYWVIRRRRRGNEGDPSRPAGLRGKLASPSKAEPRVEGLP